MNSVRLLLPAALAALLLISAGCSTFNEEYQAALQDPSPRDDVTGPWEGTWRSDKSGHTGPLKCVVSQQDDGLYEMHFKAGYKLLFNWSYSYRARFELQPHNDGYEFSGTTDLGWLAGGDYYYEGRIDPADFYSTFRSGRDFGTFEMTRPELATQDEE